jgi:hypothetical protein
LRPIERILNENRNVSSFIIAGVIMPTLCGASVKDLAAAAKTFSATIRTQLETLDRDPSPAELVQATISYAQAKAEYYKVLSDEMPELMAIALGKQGRPPELDTCRLPIMNQFTNTP